MHGFRKEVTCEFIQYQLFGKGGQSARTVYFTSVALALVSTF